MTGFQNRRRSRLTKPIYDCGATPRFRGFALRRGERTRFERRSRHVFTGCDALLPVVEGRPKLMAQDDVFVRHRSFRYADSEAATNRMNLQLYTDAALSMDLPECGLRRGDIVKLVDEVAAPDGTRGCAVEVLNALGDTVDVHTIPASAVEPLREDEVLCVRPRIAAAA